MKFAVIMKFERVGQPMIDRGGAAGRRALLFRTMALVDVATLP
jgi:hypothetical protein